MVSTNGVPEFSNDALPASGKVAAFSFLTDDGFTFQTAKNENFIIGLGGSSTGGGSTSPAAVFIPEPNQQYQIQPRNIFYLTTGHYTQGSLINVQQMSSTVLKLDFTSGAPSISVVHTPTGQLVLQK